MYKYINLSKFIWKLKIQIQFFLAEIAHWYTRIKESLVNGKPQWFKTCFSDKSEIKIPPCFRYNKTESQVILLGYIVEFFCILY